MQSLIQEELEQLLGHFCAKRQDYEKRRAQYDIRESIMAVDIFSDIADTVDHQDDMAQYSKLLEEKVRDYQSRYPAHLRGEYSGGYATLGSCLVEFQSILEEQPNFHEAVEYINTKYDDMDERLSLDDLVDYIDATYSKDEKVKLYDALFSDMPPAPWQKKLLKNVLIIVGGTVYFVVLNALFV